MHAADPLHHTAETDRHCKAVIFQLKKKKKKIKCKKCSSDQTLEWLDKGLWWGPGRSLHSLPPRTPVSPALLCPLREPLLTQQGCRGSTFPDLLAGFQRLPPQGCKEKPQLQHFLGAGGNL